MQITLTKRQILFAMSPVRIANSLHDYNLAKQLKDSLDNYQPTTTDEEGNTIPGNEDEPCTITITLERFITLYKSISGMPEGMTAALAQQIMDGTPPTTPGLMQQTIQGIQAEDPDWMAFYGQILEEKQAHATTLENHINANLFFIKNLQI